MSSVLDVPALLVLALVTVSSDDPGATANARLQPDAISEPHARTAERIYSDDDWLRTFRRHGEAVGYGALSERIFKTGSGRHYVPVALDKRQILGLKRNAQAVAGIVAESGRAHALRLTPVLGRPAIARDLLAAHVLGVEAAAKLLDEAARNPNRPAAETVPEAALSYPALFFAGTRPRSTSAIAHAFQSEIDHALRHRSPGAAKRDVAAGGWQTATIQRR